jgi:hypothetical protein
MGEGEVVKVSIWRMGVVAMVLVAGGCASQRTSLNLVSFDKKHGFAQTFSEAYCSKDKTGDTDVVLIADPAPGEVQDPKKPLMPEPVADAPRQVVHIRIYWKPMLGTKADHPASTNASCHWYLIDTFNPNNMIEYSGSGLVELDDSDDPAMLEVRTAWMKVARNRGTMVDPLGPCTLNGKIRAKVDAQEVKSILAALKVETAPVAEAHAGSSGEPANLMVGR